MQFKLSAAAVLAFVASTIAQTAGFDGVTAPAAWEKLPAGKTFKVQWDVPPAYKDKVVAISLIGGETQGTQVPLLDIASGIPNSAGQYDWAIPATLGDANVYGLVIKVANDPSIFQYSNPFKIEKSTAPPKTTGGNQYSVTTDAAPHVTKTVSLSSQAGYSVTVDVDTTVTVPCNETVSSTTAPVYSAPSAPASAPVIYNPYTNNSTWTTMAPATSVPCTTAPGVPVQTPVYTPPASPVVPGAGARVGAGSMAVLGGLLIAAFAL
ncbi:Ser-Thr-rich glycosyl-phosphatidyl-inositol-anchored membrane family-domain-containing protein [Mariannaea sp. PMI_226]|nr:Ser-Thr-rich glycosyl-phosphatidyl-inositol-anchored membrane family-domain-containing protein [Mariannaea sp. PMI_226]